MSSPDPRVRVLVVDDHDLFAEALTLFLARDDRIEVIGTVADGASAIDLAVSKLADVVLMDVFMRGMDGLEATKRLRTIRPETRVIILSGLAGDEIGDQARQAGAEAHLEKGNVHEHRIEAILAAAAMPSA